MVIGRERELAELAALVSGLADGPVVALIQGEAGIGKTTIWEAGLATAEDAGVPVLVSRAVEGEMRLSFTAVGDLMDGRLDSVLPELPGPQGDALEVALLRARPEAGRAPDRRAVAAALLGALRTLAAEGPLIVAIDDTQWLDGPSATAIAFALRRLREEPVGFLLTQRTPADAPLGLDRPPAGQRSMRIEVGPLSLAALQRLLRTTLGEVLSRPALRKVEAASGGNPFFALELARALSGRWDELPPGEPLPVPEGLQALVRDRLTGLPAETTEALLEVALLAEPSAERLAPGALRPALAAGVIRVDEPGGQVRFTHPLLAAAIVDSAGRESVQATHRQLADSAESLEARARHLALGTQRPSEAVAEELERAARSVAERGAPETAADLAEHAGTLTPAGDPSRWRRLNDAALFAWAAGDAGRSARLLGRVIDEGHGPVRVHALIRQARLDIHAGDRRSAAAVYRRALTETGEDRHLLAELHEGLAWCLFLTREDIAGAAEHARLAVGFAEAAGDAVLLGDALSVQAQAEFFMGGGLPSEPMERALALAPGTTSDVRVLRQPRMHWAVLLQCSDRLEEARETLAQVHTSAEAAGDDSAAPWVLMRRSQVELLAGRLRAAAELAERGHELAVETHQQPLEAMLLCARALAYAHLGDPDAARAAAAEGLPLAEGLGDGIGVSLGRWGLGALALSLDDPQAAVAELEPLQRDSEAAGIIEPGATRWTGDLIEALIALGRLGEAAALTEQLDARASAVGRQSAAGVANRSRALLDAARGSRENAIERLAASARDDEQPLPLEHARTLLALGSLLRRAGRKRDARESLTRARAEFEGLGAALWEARADAELGRIGGRRAHADGELTDAERRVAALVAEGHTNREVAAALFLSERTVESHLSRIYRKLAVRSRAELARNLGQS